MKRVVLLTSSFVLAGIAAPITAAQARPQDQFSFDDTADETIEGYCGDQTVRLEVHESGGGVGRIAGRDRTLRYTVRIHGDATITNLATGRAFTLSWNYIDQEKQVTHNGDGTISIVGISPGSESVRGPDGKLLDVKPGIFRWVVVLNDGGTPTDPSDDTFVSISFLSGPGVYSDFCDDFRALTG